MSNFGPLVAETLPNEFTRIPAAPDSCAGDLEECCRLQWRLGEAGDPAALVEDFLADHGLPVRGLARLGAGGAAHGRTPVCGAALFVSAAAGARMVRAPVGAPTPVPALPDVVAVVYRHRRPGRSGGSARGPGPAGTAAAAPADASGAGADTRANGSPWRIGPWQDSWSPSQYAAAVGRVREAIGWGEVYQVNLVGHAHAPYVGDPLPALARLGGLPGARYGGVLTGAGWAIGCASPETLVEVAGGRIRTRPIKGTRSATAQGRQDLLDSVKERAEHIMIVDLERNDLAQVARTGSVRVDELYAIRRWCDLWQAESVVSAAVDDGLGLADLLRAVCPGGSVTGAPKLAALGRIAALEPVGRGASMGALGWVGPDGIDLGLTIRTAAVDADRVHLWAGGGITWGSDPWAEVAEAAAKADPVRAALAGTPAP